MKNKKCPYCGRRISYWNVFNSKSKGIYECSSCNKKSKVKIDKRMIALFVILCLLILVFMLMWNMFLGLTNNIFGVIIVAVLVFGFYFTTPLFVGFVPIKSVLEDSRKRNGDSVDIDNMSTDFKFNREAFDIIKQRKAQANNIPEEPNNIVENLIKSFKTFQHILLADIQALDDVEGIGEIRAKNIKQSLKRMQEQYVFDNVML